LIKLDSRLPALMLVLPVAVVPVRMAATMHGPQLVSVAMMDFQLLPTLELAEAVPLAVEDIRTLVPAWAILAKRAAMVEVGLSTFGTKLADPFILSSILEFLFSLFFSCFMSYPCHQ
jgi:hypothetical protein